MQLKRFKCLVEKRGKCQWLVIRADVDGKVVAPTGWKIVRTVEL